MRIENKHVISISISFRFFLALSVMAMCVPAFQATAKQAATETIGDFTLSKDSVYGYYDTCIITNNTAAEIEISCSVAIDCPPAIDCPVSDFLLYFSANGTWWEFSYYSPKNIITLSPNESVYLSDFQMGFMELAKQTHSDALRKDMLMEQIETLVTSIIFLTNNKIDTLYYVDDVWIPLSTPHSYRTISGFKQIDNKYSHIYNANGQKIPLLPKNLNSLSVSPSIYFCNDKSRILLIGNTTK
jgi:hypothetical protein